MSQSTHHRFHSLASSVPFSWENSPGISKITPTAADSPEPMHAIEPPPPPYLADDSPRRLAGRHSIHVPLPPCPFQPPPSRYLRRDEDPFLAAYIECTKSMKKKEGKKKKRSSSGWGLSCKQGSGVREDGLVRVSQVAEMHGRDRDRWWLERNQSQSPNQNQSQSQNQSQRRNKSQN